jgi:hypothetical protein
MPKRIPALFKKVLAQATKIRMPKDYFTERPQCRLLLNYAMLHFVNSKLGFKIPEADPTAFFNASWIKEKKELQIHLRMPVKDEWFNLIDYVDIDIYFPQNELEKIKGLLTN